MEISFSPQEIQDMREFYESEYNKTLRHLEHLKNTLEKISAASQTNYSRRPKPYSPSDTIYPGSKYTGTSFPDYSEEPGISETNKPTREKGITKPKTPKSINVTAIPDEAPTFSTMEKERTEKTEKKKRGPKSKWGGFILKTLKEANKPMTYNELVDEAKNTSRGSRKDEESLRQSILNSAFRLRTILGKIDTISVPGQREKYLGLKSWFNGREIQPEYAKRVGLA